MGIDRAFPSLWRKAESFSQHSATMQEVYGNSESSLTKQNKEFVHALNNLRCILGAGWSPSPKWSVKVPFRFNKFVEWLQGNLMFNLCIDHVNMWFSKCFFAAAEPSIKLHFRTCFRSIVYLKWAFVRVFGKRVTFWNVAFETVLERSVKSVCTFWGHSFKSKSVYGAYTISSETNYIIRTWRHYQKGFMLTLA